MKRLTPRGRRLGLLSLAIAVAVLPADFIALQAGCPTGPLDITVFGVLISVMLFNAYNGWRNTTR